MGGVLYQRALIDMFSERDLEGAMRAIFRRFFRDRRGATAIEYAMIVMVLSLAIVASINSTHNELQNMFVRLADKFSTGTN